MNTNFISKAYVYLLLILVPVSVFSQEDDYFEKGFTRYENYIYKSTIKTVRFEKAGLELTDPIFELGSNQSLILSFDDLDGDFKNYSYTLIHCDAAWRPSNLIENEYLTGFFEERVYDYRQSFNTLQPYTHYSVSVPGRDVRPKISGNFLLKLYEEGNPDEPVITRRMLIYEQLVGIQGYVKRATLAADRYTKHEIDFSIIHPALPVTNAFSEIKVVLMQNGRWDNAITDLKPLFLKDKELEYDYEEENTFYAGNEFRTFDIRTIRMQTQWVDRIIRAPGGYTAVLLKSKSRATKSYAIENDINGKFLVRYQEGQNSDLEGEYVHVKFILDHPVMANGSFHVFGGLTDWGISNENKMTYNYDEEVYEALLYLKQGYYDYKYVFVEDGKSIIDETIIEGSHYETRNEYFILVYYRPVGGRFDRLVGFTRLQNRI
jgi:type 9 secretion system plug protein